MDSHDTPAFEATTRVALAHTPERVHSALSDRDRLGRWLPGLVSVDPADGEEPAVGSEWVQRRIVLGREESARVRVLAYEPPERLAFETTAMTDDAGRFEYAFRILPSPGGSIVDAEVRGWGVFGPRAVALARFLVEPFRRHLEDDLEALDRYLAAPDSP